MAPRRDDREVGALVPGGQHPLDQLPVHVELGAACECHRPHLGRDRVDRMRGARERGNFVGFLHHPDGRHDLRRARERTARPRALEIEHEPRPRVVADRDAPGRGGYESGYPRDRIVGLLPRHEREQLGPELDAWRLQARDDEMRVAGAREHQHREPFEGHRLVADEVGQVGPDGQEQRVDAELGHARADTLDADGERHAPSPGRPSMLTVFLFSQ